jgi:hypothetical protein
MNVFVVNSKSLLFDHLPEETYTISIKFSIEHVCLPYNTLDFYMGGIQVDGSYADRGFCGCPQCLLVDTRLVP